MANAFFNVPTPANEPVRAYVPGTKEHTDLINKYRELYNQPQIEVPLYIGGKEIKTDDKRPMSPPHDHQKILGYYNQGNGQHVEQAINAAMKAREAWANTPWEQRAAVFLRAAELLAGPFRDKMNAATMLAQSKNVFQAEIDAACEMIDFFRFNVQYMTDIYKDQPISSPGVWNRMEYRPLEGFVFALSPFNFTSICANLSASPALMGNVVVWKPAASQVYSAAVIMELFKEAGLPDGVINMVAVDGSTAGEVIFKHRDFAGIHFTGSTNVFRNLWKTMGENLDKYKSYPRIVGETGGKDFVVAHKSANAVEVATALSRGAFEYQGQKCSAASRAYIPSNLWNEVKDVLVQQVSSMKMGSPEDTSNFINAVIDKKAFTKISEYIEYIKSASDAEIVVGGHYDGSKGYFIEPTVCVTTNPKFKTLEEEIFGPVLTIYVYDENKYEETLHLVDETSEYALTGSIMATDRYAIELAVNILRNAAGNFYINDKPTGAVVGQQPFGGARGSGTNDKAGSAMNLIRWTSMRTIKETFVTPKDYKYPFLG
ncbi:MAG: L-glutamate gamma-semialdehyde dehydrogenase [Crocinitomicaceae bacterium]|nr:L-glutamate gamma-semialdehyde dehydrogenase [Crocinitomicaceae bacterium]